MYENDETVHTFKGIDLASFKKDFKIVGIIGSDYFVKNNLIIDYKNKIIKTK